MFTGIIEQIGTLTKIEKEAGNRHLTISSPMARELKIDQSVAHDGVCLTVVDIQNDQYQVTAIDETLRRSNLQNYQIGQKINLERSLTLSQRLDGHWVQGHVDTVATCTHIDTSDGSWIFTFLLPTNAYRSLMVEKGSICINGVSLTLLTPTEQEFQVAIIPYTYQNTNFHNIQSGDLVNVEFDILGKYVARNLHFYKSSK